MTNAKSNTTGTAGTDDAPAPKLTWRSKSEWGAIGNTHRTESTDWKYVVDQPRKGFWQLRGWGPDGLFLYREDTTMKGCKAQAADHVRDRAAAAAEAARVLDALDQQGPKIVAVDEGALLLATAPARTDDHVRDCAAAAAEADRVMTELADALRTPWSCDCPGITHTMRCGAGGRATVVRTTCTECFRINHKMDCSKGRAA